jgi:excisionase family DNA binding protein
MKILTFNELPQAVTQLNERLENIERLLTQKKAEPCTNADELLTIQQAADFLHISTFTIYGLVSRSVIPSMKRGKRLYFSKDELTAWVKATRKKTASEAAKDADTFLANQKKRG